MPIQIDEMHTEVVAEAPGQLVGPAKGFVYLGECVQGCQLAFLNQDFRFDRIKDPKPADVRSDNHIWLVRLQAQLSQHV